MNKRSEIVEGTERRGNERRGRMLRSGQASVSVIKKSGESNLTRQRGVFSYSNELGESFADDRTRILAVQLQSRLKVLEEKSRLYFSRDLVNGDTNGDCDSPSAILRDLIALLRTQTEDCDKYRKSKPPQVSNDAFLKTESDGISSD